MINSNRFILMALFKEPLCFLVSKSQLKREIEHGDRLTPEGIIGHFDWLRQTSGLVVGVRFWPFDDGDYSAIIKLLFNHSASLEYAILDQDHSVSFFFSAKTCDFDDDLSQDQDLDDCGVLRLSRYGEIPVIYFSSDGLLADENSFLAFGAGEGGLTPEKGTVEN